MRRPALLGAAVLGATLAAAGTAQAYTCLLSNCKGWCPSPVPYALGKASDDLGPEATVTEVQRAFDAWAALPCTNLKVQYNGRTEEPSRGANAVVDWIEAEWPHGSGAIGVTSSRGSNGCLTSNMVLNGVNFKWVAGATMRGQVNTFSIVGHEAGHYLGLGHSTAPQSMMAARYSGGVLAITEDDQMGMCRLYPAGGSTPRADASVSTPRDAGRADASPAASTPRDAAGTASMPTPTPAPMPAPTPTPMPPSGSTPRDAGSAAPARPTPRPQPDGERCAINDDCASALCFEAPDVPPLCTRRCASDTECVPGLSCQAVGRARLCLPGRADPVVPERSAATSSGCALGGLASDRPAGILALLAAALAVIVARRTRRA